MNGSEEGCYQSSSVKECYLESFQQKCLYLYDCNVNILSVSDGNLNKTSENSDSVAFWLMLTVIASHRVAATFFPSWVQWAQKEPKRAVNTGLTFVKQQKSILEWKIMLLFNKSNRKSWRWRQKQQITTSEKLEGALWEFWSRKLLFFPPLSVG